jgi:chromosome segregation ATPase
MEDTKNPVQLTLDNATFEADPSAVKFISESITKRDSIIQNLKNELDSKTMKEYKVGDTYRKYDSLDAMFGDFDPLYKDMKSKCDEMMNKYNDMKSQCDAMKVKCDEMMTKYNDMSAKYNDMAASCSMLEKKDSEQTAEIEKLSGENLILKSEVEKRFDSNEIETKVSERCSLINEVSQKLKLDSVELLTLSNEEIKIKAIQSTCDFPVEKTMEKTFIDGAYAMAMRLPRSDFAEQKNKIENIRINRNTNNDEVDEATKHFKRQIEKLNGVK